MQGTVVTGSGEVQRQPEISKEIDRIIVAVDALRLIVAKLEERLSPVTVPEVRNEEKCEQEETPETSMGHVLREQGASISMLVRSLRSLERRLEV
jgi:hypothetical protein